MHFGSGAMTRGLGHAVEDLADGGLLAAPRQFEIRASHVERGSAPVIAEAGELRSSGVGGWWFERETSRDGRDIDGAEVGGEHSEVGVAGVCDGGGEIDVAVSVGEPASGGSAEAGVLGIFENVLLAIGQRGERLDQRSHGDGGIGMIPALGENASGVGVEEEIGNVAVGEVLVQGFRGRLREQRSVGSGVVGGGVSAAGGGRQRDEGEREQQRDGSYCDHS